MWYNPALIPHSPSQKTPKLSNTSNSANIFFQLLQSPYTGFQILLRWLLPGVEWHTLANSLSFTRLGLCGGKLSRGKSHSCRNLYLLSVLSLAAEDSPASGLVTQLGERVLIIWEKNKKVVCQKIGSSWSMFMVCYTVFVGYDGFLVCIIFYCYYFVR